MAPVDAAQVTPWLEESLATVAVNACVAPPMSVALVGLTATEIATVEVAVLPLPPQPVTNIEARKTADKRRFRQKFDIGPSLLLRIVGNVELCRRVFVNVRYTEAQRHPAITQKLCYLIRKSNTRIRKSQ